jgi:hypothetical protein
MSEITVTCPQRRRIAGRRHRHTLWWQDPRWIAFRDEHARVPGAECAHCHYHHGEQLRDRQGNLRYYKTGKNIGKPILAALTINHRDRESYHTFEDYLKWDPLKMEVCCGTCNMMWERGMVICPVCNVNYIHWSADPKMCRECREDKNPELKKEREEKEARQKETDRNYQNARNKKKRAKLNPFPCAYKLLTGRCSKSQQQCTFSRQKCLRDPKLGGCPKSKKRVEKKCP